MIENQRYKNFFGIFLGALLLIVGSGHFNSAQLSGGLDSPASVDINTPLAGESVSGQISVAANTPGVALSMSLAIEDEGGVGQSFSMTYDTSQDTWTYTWDTEQLNNGNYTLTVTASDDLVSVESQPIQITIANIQEFILSYDNASLKAGEEKILETFPSTILVTCSSSDEAVAITQVINDRCQVTGISQGAVDITASSNDWSDIAHIAVTPSRTDAFTLTPQVRTIDVGEVASLLAAPAVSITSCSSSDESIVSVTAISSGCEVTGISSGEVSITASSSDSTSNASVTVSAQDERVADQSSSQTARGSSIPRFTLTPANFKIEVGASTTFITRPLTLLFSCTSSDQAVASATAFDDTCQVSAFSVGTTTITASSMLVSETAILTVYEKEKKHTDTLATTSINVVTDATTTIQTKEEPRGLAISAQKRAEVEEKIKNVVPRVRVRATDIDVEIRKELSVSPRDNDYVSFHPSRDSAVSSSVVILFDSDGDGVSDDTERRIGTNPNSTDSDKDGIPDATAALALDLSPIDKALVAGLPLQQPTNEDAGLVDETFVVSEVVQEDDTTVIRGIAEPNSVVTIFIYSYVPLVLTVETDENGAFEYTLTDELQGETHLAYVALHQEDGTIDRKSTEFAFAAAISGAILGEQESTQDVDEVVLEPEEVIKAPVIEFSMEDLGSAKEELTPTTSEATTTVASGVSPVSLGIVGAALLLVLTILAFVLLR